jgi:hypothetical protein
MQLIEDERGRDRPASQLLTADGVWKTAQANWSTLRPRSMRSLRIRAPISCAGVTSGLRRCARARPAASQEHDQDHERHDGVGQSWHLQANDARLWHPWLRITRLLRSMLHERWSAEAWAQVRVEFKKTLALRSQIRRAGWFN